MASKSAIGLKGLTIIQWSPSLCIHYNASTACGHKPALCLNNNPSNQNTSTICGSLVCPDRGVPPYTHELRFMFCSRSTILTIEHHNSWSVDA